MYSKKDFEIGNIVEFLEFLPVFIFVALVFPFILVAYKLGFVMDIMGWLDKP